jgi:hypothetical protein
LSEFPALNEYETLLEDESELLWRQVNPGWIDGGRITSQSFKATPKDEGMPSVARSTKLSAQEAFEQYGFASAGTWAIAVGKVIDCGSRAVDDSATPNAPFGHAYFDMRNLSRGRQEKIAAKLRDHAQDRGKVFPPSA